MGQHILAGNPPVPITLRHSPRARRISLRVSGLDGRVTLTVPRGVQEHEALAFAHEKAGWLRAQLTSQPGQITVQRGSVIPLEGVLVEIARGTGRGIRHEGARLQVPGLDATVPARVKAWLKGRARDRLAAASDDHAARLGRSYSRLTLRDTRSRWGSCTAQGGLMYSWRLILAPPEVLNYVAAHEVAHLAQMNHSPAFWAEVAALCPGYEEPRRWLRRNGAELHRYRFTS